MASNFNRRADDFKYEKYNRRSISKYRGSFETGKSSYGAKVTVKKDAESGEIREYVTGWFFNKFQGLVTALAFAYKDTKVHKGKNYDFENWMVKIKYHQSGVEKLLPCLRNITNNNILINSENMVILPKGGRSRNGWFGRVNG